MISNLIKYKVTISTFTSKNRLDSTRSGTTNFIVDEGRENLLLSSLYSCHSRKLFYDQGSFQGHNYRIILGIIALKLKSVGAIGFGQTLLVITLNVEKLKTRL